MPIPNLDNSFKPQGNKIPMLGLTPEKKTLYQTAQSKTMSTPEKLANEVISQVPKIDNPKPKISFKDMVDITTPTGTKLIDDFILKQLNKPSVKKIATGITEATTDLPLKARAVSENMWSKVLPVPPEIKNRPYSEILNSIKNEYDQGSEIEKFSRELSSSAIQTTLGVVLGMIPAVGRPASGAYYSALSAGEQIQDKGEVYSTTNIAIDTVGDMLLGNGIENILSAGPNKILSNIFGIKGSKIVQGAITEGLTEPAQTLLKYTNNYYRASSPEQRKGVVDELKSYVKDGGLLKEFLISFISGGMISGGLSIGGDVANVPPTISKTTKDKENTQETIVPKETVEKIKEIVKTEKPEIATVEIAESLGMSEGNAQEVVNATQQVLRQEQIKELENLTPEEIIASTEPTLLTEVDSEIDSILGSQTIDINKELKQVKEDLLSQIPEDVKNEAKEELDNSVLEEYSNFMQEQEKLKNEAKLQPKEEKAKTVEKIKEIDQKIETLEDNFTSKYEKDGSLDEVSSQLNTPRDAAKGLIRSYILRGDTTKSLVKGMLGSASSDYHAQVGGYVNQKKIKPTQIAVTSFKGKELKKPEIFDIEKIAEEIRQEGKPEEKPKTQKEKVEESVKSGPKTIKDIAKETKIKEPNVRRILGVGAKEGTFERVEKGVYVLSKNGKDTAYIEVADAVEALPRLAKEGFKADMIFLDIPYDTPAVKGGNRGVKYGLISVEDFSKVLDAVLEIANNQDTPVVHMFSQAPSGIKKMQKYNDLFIEKGFKPVGKGQYQKTFADGSPTTGPNGKVSQPEGILVFTQSGELKKDLEDLNFTLRRPKGYQTEKPAEMLKAIIEMTTEEGDVVLDPFAGSGVTGAEAVRAGRVPYLIEKNTNVAENITKPRVKKAIEELDNEVKKDDNIDNGTKISNAGRGVLNRGIPERVRDVEEGQDMGGSTSQVNSDSLARGEDTVGGYSLRDGSRSSVTNEEIQNILESKTEINNDGEVSILKDFTEEELNTLKEYKPSGGMEKKGATGKGLLDEYFTDERVTLMTTRVLEDLGVLKNDSIILEPSVGVGNFLEDLPVGSEITGFEINPTTARITKVFNPEATIINKPLESLFIDDRGNKKDFTSEYDIVIGNPPYGEHRGKYKGLGEEPKISKYEEYFIKRSLDLAVDGGYVAMVVPSSILRNKSSKSKELIAEIGELVDAYRLPNGAFETTDIGTDILIFKKSKAVDNIAVISRVTTISDDMYFRSVVNKDKILGEEYIAKGKFGEEVKVRGTIEEALQKFNLIKPRELAEEMSVYTQEQETKEDIEEIAEGLSKEYKPEDSVEIAESVEVDMDAMENISEVPSTVLEKRNTEKAKKELKKRNWADIYRAETLPEFNESKLFRDMDIFVDKIEPLTEDSPVDSFWYQKGFRFKATMSYPFSRGENGNTATFEYKEYPTQEEIAKSMLEVFEDFKNKVNTPMSGDIIAKSSRDENIEIAIDKVLIKKDKIEKLINKKTKDSKVNTDINPKVTIVSEKPTESTISLLDTVNITEQDILAFENTESSGNIINTTGIDEVYIMDGRNYSKFNYLQGNVYAKLEQLEKDRYMMTNPQYEKQKADLESIIPTRQTVDKMSISPNTRFVNELVLSESEEVKETLETRFRKWLTTLPRTAFGKSSLYSIRGYISNEAVRGGSALQNAEERKTRREEGDRLFKLFLNDELTKEEKGLVEDQYNRQFNSYHRPDYSKVPLKSNIHSTFHGSKLELRDVQKQGIGFLVNKGVGLLAHEVGVGKTLQGIIAIAETMNRGWAKKPLVVVPSINVYKQWVKEIQEVIPDVKINLLANLGGDFKGDINNLKIPDNTISVVTYEGLKKIGFKQETYESLTQDFKDAIAMPSDTKRSEEKENARAEEQVAKGIKGTEATILFEDLGFDLLTFDEVHNANHIIGNVKMDKKGATSEFRGLQQRPSELGLKTWLASQYIQKMNNGRNVYLLSATPFTNNPLEYYSILSLMARNRLKEMRIYNANDFINMFMELSVKYEFKADGKYIESTDVRGHKNYQQFTKLLTEFIDFRDGEEAGVQRPNKIEKKIYVKPTEDQVSYFKEAEQLFELKDEAGALQAINEFRQTAFSPYASRYNTSGVPTYKEFVENSPKIKMLVEMIKENTKKEPSAGQLIYSTIGSEYYPLIKEYLVKEAGFKPSEVDIISGSTPKNKRFTVQEGFNKGDIKVVIGSDAIKEGINLQKNTTDLYILSLPWNFTQLKQVIGRGWRHGNKWKNIRINNLFVENSIDVFLSQKLETKATRYEEGLRFRGDFLDTSDVDFNEVKFDLVTDPVLRHDLETKMKVEELKAKKVKIEADAAYIGRRVKEFVEVQQIINTARETLKENESDKDGWVYKHYSTKLKDATEKKTELIKTYKEKGIDVDNIEKEMSVKTEEADKIKLNIENIEAEAKTKRAELEKEAPILRAQEPTDYEGILNNLRKENEDFYELRDTAYFERVEDFNDGLSDLESTGITLRTLEKLEDREIVSKQFIQDLTKSAEIKKQEREILDDVLANFPDGSKINVKEFKRLAEEKLLPLRVAIFGDIFGVTDIPAHGPSQFSFVNRDIPDNFDLNKQIDYQERVYEAPFKIKNISHFKDARNYFGHTRVENITDKIMGKVVRNVIEVQSDLFQKGKFNSESEEFSKKRSEQEQKMLESYQNTWWERLIREEIKKASIDGVSEIRFPLGETAMNIEKLTGADNEWLVYNDSNTVEILTPENAEPGAVFHNEYEDWVVVENLGEGKIKVVYESHVNDVLGGEEIVSELSHEKIKTTFKDIDPLNMEVFDISNTLDKSNPIYKFYEGPVAKYLKNNFNGIETIDRDNYSWIGVKLTPELTKRPLFAFSKKNIFKVHREQEVLGTEGVKRLEWYKKRFSLDFDTMVADIIYTGGLNKNGTKEIAYGVTSDNTIAFAKWIKKTTSDHEFLHLIMRNLKEINTFKDFSKYRLLKEMNNGSDFHASEAMELEERLAEGYQKYINNRESSGVKGYIRQFFDKLTFELEKVFKALKGRHTEVQNFYRELYFGTNKTPINLNNQNIINRISGGNGNNHVIDFHRYKGDVISRFQKVFEDLPFTEEHTLLDYTKKDINNFIKYTAIANDIYLEDKEQFKSAKTAEEIEERRRMQKDLMDNKYADILKPFYDLNSESKKKVVEVLMKGDDDRVIFNEGQLDGFNLNQEEKTAYLSVREAFDTAFEELITKMQERGVKPEEIETYRYMQAGYMPHKWEGKYALKTQEMTDDGWRTTYMEAFKTKRELERAKAKISNMKNPNMRFIVDTLDPLEVDFFSEQRFSFENMKSIIEQAKSPKEIKEQMIDAIRNAIKEKGFGRHFISRTGVRGFDTENMPKYIADYFTGFTGFLTKMEAGQKHLLNLANVDARRQKNFYEWLRDYIAFNMGNTRDLNALKQISFAWYLANDVSFLLLNMTQNLIIGTGELSKLFKGAGRIFGAETALAGAFTSWVTGNVSKEEKNIIEQLLKLGRLGGEMSSELLGFKNNPIYKAYSKGLNWALYNSTSFIETHVNRVPAFLAARRQLIKNGVSNVDATNQALDISDNIHFRYGKAYRPVFMRNKYANVYFTFSTYARSWFYILYQNMKRKDFLAVTKTLSYSFLLGGAAGLPMAKLVQLIVKELMGKTDDDEEKELNQWEIALKKGLPAAFLNIDLSNSVGVGIMQLDNAVNAIMEEEITRKELIRLLGGAFGGIGVRVTEGVDLLTQGRIDEGFGKTLPDFIGNIFKAYHGTVYGVHTMAGNPLIDPVTGDNFQYTTQEGVYKALGFTIARESLAWDATMQQWRNQDKAQAERDPYRLKIKAMVTRGNIEEAKALQEEAIQKGIISERTDYIKPLIENDVYKQAIINWNSGQKSTTLLNENQVSIATQLYGEDYTPQQLNTVTKDFGFYRYFGFNNSWANKIKDATTNADKLDILNQARQELGLEAFRELFNTGRRTVNYKSGYNTYILISDNLRDMYMSQN